MRGKVILVEREDAQRIWHSAVLEIAGYEVHEFKDGQAALGEIVQNGEAPFVLVGDYFMGYENADDMRKSLNMHTERRTGVKYGLVAFGVPDLALAREPLEEMEVPYSGDNKISDLIEMIDDEFARITA